MINFDCFLFLCSYFIVFQRFISELAEQK